MFSDSICHIVVDGYRLLEGFKRLALSFTFWIACVFTLFFTFWIVCVFTLFFWRGSVLFRRLIGA